MLHFFLGVLAGLIIGWILEWAMDWSVLRPLPKRHAVDPNDVYAPGSTHPSTPPQGNDNQVLSPTASDDTTHIVAAEDD